MPSTPSPTPLVTQAAGSNPVAQPNVSSKTPATPQTNPQGLTPAQMSAFAETQAKAQANPGTVASTRVIPLPAQGPEAPGSRIESYTTNPAVQKAQALPEVQKLTGSTPEQASARYDRAQAVQAGNVVYPASNINPQTGQTGTAPLGVTYDTATGFFQDPNTKNYYSGFDPNLGHTFSPDEHQAISAMFATPDTGVVTTDSLGTSIQTLGDVIARASDPANALPFSSTRTNADNVSTPVGSMWKTSLTPDMQAFVQSLYSSTAPSVANSYGSPEIAALSAQVGAEGAALASGTDSASLELKQLRDDMAAREQANIGDIQAKADQARQDQNAKNDLALSKAKVFFASIGGTGSSQELQYVADTISGGERALRDIGVAEQDAITQAQDAFANQEYDLAFKQIQLSDQRRQEYKQDLTSLIGLKQNFEQMAMQKQQFQQQVAQNDLDFAVKSGAEYSDLSPQKKQEFADAFGVDQTGLQKYFQTAAQATKLQNLKDQADVQKSFMDMASSSADLALKIPEGKSFSTPLPDGSSYTIQGMKPLSDDYSTTTAQLGSTKYGPPGQYILTHDKVGNIVNAQYIGDSYVAPHYDADTSSWQTYNPANNTTTTVFNGGQYNEGFAGMSNTNSYTQALTDTFGEPVSTPGNGNSSWTYNTKPGTTVGAPITHGTVISVGATDASSIAAAIKQVESGGNYQARGASGESGAYQFMPSTWAAWAQKYLGDSNASMTPENQDAVANAHIQDLLNQGHTPQEIALIWNGGSTQVKSGTNKYGVAYDTGAYAQKVMGALQKQGQTVQVQDQTNGAVYNISGLSGVSVKPGQQISASDILGTTGTSLRLTPLTASGQPVLPPANAKPVQTQQQATPSQTAQPQTAPDQIPIDQRTQQDWINAFVQDRGGKPFNPNSKSDSSALISYQKSEQTQARAEETQQRQNASYITRDPNYVKTTEGFNQRMVAKNEFDQAYSMAINDPKSGVAARQLMASLERVTHPNPTTVIRTSEIQNLENSASLPQQAQAYLQKILTGQSLQPDQINDMKSLADNAISAEKGNYDQTISSAYQQAIMSGIDPRIIGRPYKQVIVTSPQGQQFTADSLSDPDLIDAVKNQGYTLQVIS